MAKISTPYFQVSGTKHPKSRVTIRRELCRPMQAPHNAWTGTDARMMMVADGWYDVMRMEKEAFSLYSTLMWLWNECIYLWILWINMNWMMSISRRSPLFAFFPFGVIKFCWIYHKLVIFKWNIEEMNRMKCFSAYFFK